MQRQRTEERRRSSLHALRSKTGTQLRLQQAVRAGVQLCQLALSIYISLLLLIPRQIIRLTRYFLCLATNILRAVLPSNLHAQLSLTPPLTPRDAHRNLRSHHFPPVLIRRQFLTVGHELMATELLSIEPFTLLPSSSPRSASAAAADLSLPAPPPPAPASPPIHFLLITGNPGSAHFYTAFLSHLHSLSAHSLSVSCLSFAGHQSAHQLHHFTARRPYSLLDQTRLWQAFIAQLLEREPHARIVLAGHSIGAWIALQCAAFIPRGQLLHSFLLFPTLWDMSGTPAGRRLRHVFAYGQRVLPLAARLMNAALPAFIRRQLILRALAAQRWSSQSSPVTTNSLLETEDAVRTVSDLLHPACVRQILHLAHSELTTVTAAFPSASTMRELSEGRATLLCAVDDALESGLAAGGDAASLRSRARHRHGQRHSARLRHWSQLCCG